MKKKIIDKLKNIKFEKFKEVVLNNKKKLEIMLLVFLVAIAVGIFGFSSWGKNISNFVVEKINSNSAQNNLKQPIEIEKEFVSENYIKKPADLVIGVISDLHAEDNLYSMVSSFMNQVQVQQEKPEIIIEVGDFIQNRNRNGKGRIQQSREEGIAEWKKADARFLDFTPRYHVVGNHEMFSLYKKDYEDLIGNNSYYSFIAKDYQILVLDAMYTLTSGRDVERGNEEEGAYPGAIPKEEMQWLEEKLKERDKNIIFVHHPLYLLRNNIEVEKLLTKYNDKIILIVSGHKHRAKSLTFAGIDYIDMPSLELQKQYVIIKVKGNKSEVDFLNLE